jgi:hypothetical protein
MRPETQCEEAHYLRRRAKFRLTLPVWRVYTPADPGHHATRIRAAIPLICEHCDHSSAQIRFSPSFASTRPTAIHEPGALAVLGLGLLGLGLARGNRAA